MRCVSKISKILKKQKSTSNRKKMCQYQFFFKNIKYALEYYFCQIFSLIGVFLTILERFFVFRDLTSNVENIDVNSATDPHVTDRNSTNIKDIFMNYFQKKHRYHMHTLTEFWTSRCIIGEMVEEKNGEVKMTPPLVNFVNGKGLVVLGLIFSI